MSSNLTPTAKLVPVVQWIERQIPDLKVGGSSLLGRATNMALEFSNKTYRYIVLDDQFSEVNDRSIESVAPERMYSIARMSQDSEVLRREVFSGYQLQALIKVLQKSDFKNKQRLAIQALKDDFGKPRLK